MKTKSTSKKSTSQKKAQKKRKPSKKTTPKVDYAVRLNEKLTVAQINKVLDSIDLNDGYCPCQMQSADTKCHCKDFRENKAIGEPCICKIYVKQNKPNINVEG